MIGKWSKKMSAPPFMYNNYALNTLDDGQKETIVFESLVNSSVTETQKDLEEIINNID